MVGTLRTSFLPVCEATAPVFRLFSNWVFMTCLLTRKRSFCLVHLLWTDLPHVFLAPWFHVLMSFDLQKRSFCFV